MVSCNLLILDPNTTNMSLGTCCDTYRRWTEGAVVGVEGKGGADGGALLAQPGRKAL